MSGPDRSAIEALFDELADVDADRRAARLAEIESKDPRLSAAVERLLAAHDRADEVLGPIEEALRRTPAADELEIPARLAADPLGLIGRTVSGYEIRRLLGAGGMGVLYEAFDGRLSRPAALKFLTPRLSLDPALRTRLLREARAAAALDHPNICAIWEVGQTPEGELFMAMPLYSGETLRERLGRGPPTVEEALNLARQALEGLGAAHAAGLLHRDIKPGNLMLTREGTLKILDFGLATTKEPGEGDVGVKYGTPAYMPPERTRGEEVDERSDVWSLGAVLFELLTGRRASGASGTKSATGGHRSTHARAPARETGALEFPPEIDRDLAAVVSKAMRQNPADRYRSAADFACDIDRCLSAKPVAARPVGPVERLRKLARRRPREAVAGGVAIVLISAASGVAIATVWQADQEQARAEAAASTALDQARQTTGVLTAMFEAGDPRDLGIADSASIWTLMQLGLAAADSLDAHPTARAELLDVLARVHASFGRLDEAEDLASQALALHRTRGDPSLGVAASLNTLALVRKRQSRYREAETLHRQALDIQVDTLGENHPQVAETLTQLSDFLMREGFREREALYRRALAIRIRTLGPEHDLVASSWMDVGRMLRSRGVADSARMAYETGLAISRAALGPDHPETARRQVLLADLYYEQLGDLARAEALYRESLGSLQASFGADHASLIHPTSNLAWVRAARGDPTTAERMLRESLRIRRTAFGWESTDAADGMAQLARFLGEEGRLDEAERLARDAYAIARGSLGPEHAATAGHGASLGDLLVSVGAYGEAERLLLESLRALRETRGERSHSIGTTLGSLGRLYSHTADHARAEASYLEGLDIVLSVVSPAHPTARRLFAGLADVYAAWGRTTKEREYRELALAPDSDR